MTQNTQSDVSGLPVSAVNEREALLKCAAALRRLLVFSGFPAQPKVDEHEPPTVRECRAALAALEKANG
jgi:hypothetical protein